MSGRSSVFGIRQCNQGLPDPEPAVADLTAKDLVEDHNPDCFVIVYAVDDVESFSKLLL